MISLLVALLVVAAGFAGWRLVAARRRGGVAEAGETPPPAATPVAPAPLRDRGPAEPDSARAKAERVIAAEAARRKAERQKAENAARAQAERQAADNEKAAAALAATLPSPRLPQPTAAPELPDVERTAPIVRRPAAPTAVEKTQPLAPPPAAVTRAAAPATAARKAAAQTVVMLVDDSKMVRVKSSRLLAAHGFQVVTAVDGLDALAQIAAQLPDVVITDVDMPGMDGFGLVNALRRDARTRHLPLVMITSAEDRHRDEARRVGVGLLLGKPYDEAALLAHLGGLEYRVPAAPLPEPAFA